MNGSIILDSGTWSWQVFSVNELPSGPVCGMHIRFDLDGVEGSQMEFKIEPTQEEIDPGFVEMYARHPSSRQIVDSQGLSWTFYDVQRHGIAQAVAGLPAEPYRVVFRSNFGHHGLADLPADSGLGDVEDGELLEIVRKVIESDA